MTDKRGSGDELGRLDLGELGTMVFEDDGSHDHWTLVNIERNGERENLVNIRRDLGDEGFMDALEEVNQRLQGEPLDDDTTSTTPHQPVAFVCDECGLTCPRTWNATPESERDVCESCEEEQ